MRNKGTLTINLAVVLRTRPDGTDCYWHGGQYKPKNWNTVNIERLFFCTYVLTIAKGKKVCGGKFNKGPQETKLNVLQCVWHSKLFATLDKLTKLNLGLGMYLPQLRS